jgi:hypothetical protein
MATHTLAGVAVGSCRGALGQHDVGRGDERVPLGVARRQLDHALARVESEEAQGLPGAVVVRRESTCRRATRWLDEGDVGAELGEGATGELTRLAGEVDDADPVEQ